MYDLIPTYTHDTHHAYMGQGVTREELRGIHMFKFPHLLLGKRATMGSLFQNLFCQLQAKGE